MRKILLAVVAVLTLMGSEARAQFGGSAVFCTNCTTPAFQLPQWLQDFENQAQMIQQQIQMVQYQIAFWQTLIQNTIDLPDNLFADITGYISQLQDMVQQAEMLGQQSVFMINNLSDPSGYGGDLSQWWVPLAQENNSLANAAQIMGMATRLTQSLHSFYAPQIAALQSQSPSGITQAVRINGQIEASYAQERSIQANAQMAYMQVLATAALRSAHRETALDTRALIDQESAVAQECGYIVNFSPSACSAPMPPIPGAAGGGSPSAFLVPGTNTPIPGATSGTFTFPQDAGPSGFVTPGTNTTITGGTGGNSFTFPGDTAAPATSFVTTAAPGG